MVKNINQLLGQKGSLMVEALAMLGLISMVTPVLYKKAAERTTELQDINTASQMRTISKAVDGYIKDNYNSLSGGDALQLSDLEAYLPLGYTDQSKIFDGFKINVYKEGTGQTATYTGIVVGELPEDQSISTMRSSKIASMIGANGGIVDGSDIKGVQGGWEATTGDFGLGSVTTGSIAATSVHAVTSSGVNMDDVLYRNKIMGNDLYNTMATNLIMGGGANLMMGGNDIQQVSNLIAKGAEVNVQGGLGVSQGLDVAGAATIGNNLTAGVGAIFKVADVITADRRLTVSQDGIGVTGNSQITAGAGADMASLVVDGTGGAAVAKLTAGGGIVSVDKTNAQLSAGANGVFVNNSSAKMKSGVGEVLVDNVNAIMKSGGGSVAVGETDIKLLAGTNSATDNSIIINKTSGTSVRGLLTAKDGLDVIGDGVIIGTLQGGAVAPTAGSIYVQNNAYVGGSITLVGNLEAQDITARETLQGGGGNFKATDTDVTISKPSFFVKDGGDGNAFKVTSTEILLNRDTITAQGNEFNVAASTIKLDAGTAEVDGEIIAESQNFSTDLANTIIKATDSIRLESEEDMLLDTKKMVVSDKTRTDASAWKKKDTTEVTTEGVIIRRDGMIILPKGGASNRSDLVDTKGDQNVPGYIKLDRIIGNEIYKRPLGDTYPEGNNNPYDAYQVNPAYTSVMHDIKLTSRGGARLSDVLPDFINKGIYVIDNTYKESQGMDWTSAGFGTGSTQPSCSNDLNCVASPWLGFVPSPQCPPGYAKVITINPIRWKMAEAYAVADSSVFPPSTSPNFRAGLQTPTDPFGADFRIDDTIANPGIEHGHAISGGIPLTFQTNTWLNTTISALEESGTFKGWHAIMGFLYHGSDYSSYLSKVGAGSLNGKIVWNLFPVYNQEVTAISTVYCYFERRDSKGYAWDKSLVDTEYDQMVNPRSDFSKPTNYINRLNDPALKYKEIW